MSDLTSSGSPSGHKVLLHGRLRSIHFVGLCGKVTAPLAAELVRWGYAVSGSDANVQPPAADYLRSQGLHCRQGFSADHVAHRPDVVLAGPLCGNENPEVAAARAAGSEIANFASFLGREFLSRSRNAVVAGSFGKTTTTAMLTTIMRAAGRDPAWVVGGDCPDLPKPVHLRNGGFWILEGDEYPSGVDDSAPKFSHYRPETAVITSLDWVHQNRIPSLEATVGLMAGLVRSTRGKGPVFAADDFNIRRHLLPACPRGRIKTVGFSRSAEIRLGGPTQGADRGLFTLQGVGFNLGLRGKFACTNAALAALAAQAWGVALEESADALARFRGVAGRQEVLIASDELTVVYDLGLYPRSVGRLVRAFAASCRGRRLCVLFQPRHTLGRSEVYHRSLAAAFAPAGLVLLAEAINLPAARKVFPFDPQRLRRHLPASAELKEVGPALESFPAWRSEVRRGDVWLIMTEPLYPEPLASIRNFVRNLREKAGAGLAS
jgi:UDP-N-acetylmuramate: L-alanyl-gamma-D-glutamyl-meso-diaminopimelate ligase